KLKNMELIQDVDQKSKELAVSTLDLIRKNEIIKIIKDDLKKHKDTPDFEKFLSLLSDFNVNISKRDSWIKFSESFDSIDKDFIKRLHVTHNDLTSSELKLCVYLRINMSSKEIAPILGISVKSVEIKRYRIRKKLGLEHNESLNNYLFNL
ncbi:MAG: helix-turn-helix transcriptional regulator, partial [Deltaproteobacteria bacterium]